MVDKIPPTQPPSDGAKPPVDKTSSKPKDGGFSIPTGFLDACKKMFPGSPPEEIKKAAHALLQSMMQQISNTIKKCQQDAIKAMKKISGDDESDD